MSKYYDVNKLMSHNALFNFVVAGRGLGKTYGCIKWCIKRYLKTGEQFVYMRRLQTELQNKEQMFDAISHDIDFENYEFSVAGNCGYIREKSDEEINTNTWNCICYIVALSVQSTFKSTPFPNVTTIIYDEFIVDITSGKNSYLKNEPRALMECYSTIARPGTDHPRCRLLALGNNISIVNPLFTYFKIAIKPNKYGFFKAKDGLILIHVAETSETFKQDVLSSDFGKIISDTEYADYSIDNNSLVDNSAFIRRRSGNYSGMFNLSINGVTLGVWLSDDKYIFVDKTKVPLGGVHKTYNINDEDANPSWNRVGALKKSYWSKIIKQQYLDSNIYFSDLEVQLYFNECYKYF